MKIKSPPPARHKSLSAPARAPLWSVAARVGAAQIRRVTHGIKPLSNGVCRCFACG
ncbi:hypothetical protein [Gilliamella apicola]|uniref:hypothetical protein n=1 Tax=Gilliamella apicola TaxID=1196095 RepID=UPI002FEE5A3C